MILVLVAGGWQVGLAHFAYPLEQNAVSLELLATLSDGEARTVPARFPPTLTQIL